MDTYDRDETRSMCVLDDESDAHESRRRHDFGTVRDEGEEDGQHTLTEPVHTNAQTLAQESDCDTRLANDFRSQVFETRYQSQFQILKSLCQLVQPPISHTGQQQGSDPLHVVHPLFPVR